MSNDWAESGLRPALKAAGIYDPDAIALQRSDRAAAARRISRSSRSTRSRGSRATPRAGRTPRTRCLMCHSIGGAGAELGPALDGWGRGKSADVIATAIVRPSAEIAHGYEGTGDQDQGRR